jgi:hypothetical protein
MQSCAAKPSATTNAQIPRKCILFALRLQVVCLARRTTDWGRHGGDTAALCREGVALPKMDWGVFHAAHFRPHLVVVHLPDIEPKSAASALDDWLTGCSGNYTLQESRRLDILVAFELDTDAAQLSRVLGAIPGKRDNQWASKAKGRLNDAAKKRIAKSGRGDRAKRASLGT